MAKVSIKSKKISPFKEYFTGGRIFPVLWVRWSTKFWDFGAHRSAISTARLWVLPDFVNAPPKNHPIVLRNSLIIIVRHLMAHKSDEVRKRTSGLCKGALLPSMPEHHAKVSPKLLTELIGTFTVLQYINYINERPIGRDKYTLS